MPLLETLPVGHDTAQWSVWGTTARLVVTDVAALPAARQLVETELAAIDLACSRFREDSEISALRRAGGRPVQVSPLLAELLGVALRAAEETDGDVDPTVGLALVQLGYDRDFTLVPSNGGIVLVRLPAPGWREVRLTGRDVTVPAGILLDLGATAKAHAADRCAAIVARLCGTGVLVSLGGDIATAGPAPVGGWRIQILDQPDDPPCVVTLPAGTALATSSTRSRRWRRGGRPLHHILDPRTCYPARPVWRSVSVAADTCVAANTATTAALVRGRDAPAWLLQQGVPARLIAAGGDVLTLGGWPSRTDS
jgi:thiamine biosynthesis lipoprotein